MTGVYATAHMLVDLACAYLVYACVIGKQDWYLWLLVYNFCAFALQMPIGAGADRLNRNSFVAAAGCLGVLAGLILGIGGDSRQQPVSWPAQEMHVFMWAAALMY